MKEANPLHNDPLTPSANTQPSTVQLISLEHFPNNIQTLERRSNLNCFKMHARKLKSLPFADVQPDNFPVSLTPMTLGHLSSQGMSAMTSTASAPPTPMHRPPSPPIEKQK